MARKPVRKGASDLRSSARAGVSNDQPHKAYMRLCTLEMERYRREQERESAMARAQICSDRIEQIRRESGEILAALGHGAADVQRALTQELKPVQPSNVPYRY